ncbi:MAG: Nif3-like dinuclear metal center hexameric protein [Tissierellales bacterium]
MLVKEIIKLIDKIAPPKLIDKSWDNSGLQIGSLGSEINKILVSLDVSPSTVEYAIKNSIDMIISHHPLFFSPIKSILQDSIRGKMITDLIKKDISIYSVHSNLDSAEGGINEILANKFNLINTKILAKSYSDKLYKLAVFVPTSHSTIVRKTMTDSGAGYIGNYSHCTFNSNGTGTFMPRDGTNPFIGETGVIEYVEEEKIEVIVNEEDLKNVVEAMIKVHPYEEVAYDVYSLHNGGKEYGYGRIGELDQEKTLYDLGVIAKNILSCDNIKIYGEPKSKIKKVAICGGSGIDFLEDACLKNADVYITGDIKYHDAQLALEKEVSLIDAGHFYTENLVIPYIKDFLTRNLNKEVQVFDYNEKCIPFMTI